MSNKFELLAKKNYNNIARVYHNTRTIENPNGWFYNEMLEMPTVLSMLGYIKGKKILDMGCGSGIYARILRKKGALVKGFDISSEMIKIAKEENPDIEFKVGSANRIPYDEKFDIVLSPLMVHYLPDWNKMFKEVRRILKEGGIFLFSTNNPVVSSVERLKIRGKARMLRVLGDYFKERVIWRKINDKGDRIFFNHITYETLINRILNNGFEIIGYKDCYPIKKAKKYFPDDYKYYTKEPLFCVFKVKKK